VAAAEPRAARADGPASLELLGEYRRLLVERMGPHFEFATAPGAWRTARQFEPEQGGYWLLLEEDGQAVACGGFRRFDDSAFEVKRMFVTAGARRRGHGARLLAALEDEARSRGYGRVLLDTSDPLDESRRLYAAAGYRPVARYNDNQWADHWYEKEL
jgi:GNAT superfamily N-acetyltransferase